MIAAILALGFVAVLLPYTVHAATVAKPVAKPTVVKKKVIQPAAPVRLQIPRLKIDADVRALGMLESGQLETTSDAWDVGWYRYGAKPGQPGKAVMFGHLNTFTGIAVFWHLKDIQRGDTVIVTDAKRREWRFKVGKASRYSIDADPVATKLFGSSRRPKLLLVTCAGKWDWRRHQYNEYLVVTADFVSTRLVRTASR